MGGLWHGPSLGPRCFKHFHCWTGNGCLSSINTRLSTRSAWASSNVHKHIRMKNKESLPSITPPTLTSAAYTPLFPPFLLHIHSLVMTRTKDSWEGDGVSWEMTGDPFMTNAPPQCPRNCSLICHPRFLGTEKKKGRIKKNPQNSSVNASPCCVGSWSPWHEKQRLPQLLKKNKKFLQKGILIIDYFHMKEAPNTEMFAWGNSQLALWSLMTPFFFLLC